MSATDTVGVVVTDGEGETHSYMEWGAVFAGAFVAAAISLVLFTFGGGVGLSISSPFPGEGAEADTLSYITMAWVLVVMIFSFIAGGYMAGRLRRPSIGATEDAVEFRDGAHGLVVWAAGLLIGATLSAHMATGAASIGASAVGSAAGDAAIMLRGGEAEAGDRETVQSILSDVNEDGELSASGREAAAELIAETTGLSETEARARVDEWETQSREAAATARTVGAITAFLLAASALVAAAGAYFAAGMGGRHRDANSPFPWTRARS
ncbi:MAG: hypothetical protein CMI63_05780 [Parvularcula sp.]|uniref:hypothetical protein n=1 Tax=Hyphococcus sp. TaxID=2038636 RepID=UPI000C5EEBC6|nr:hypothetical protein [Parvularcula sp.]